MDRKSSNPLLDDGGFFVAPAGTDPRRSFMVNGRNYQRQMKRHEPSISLWQSLAAGLSLAVFVCGGLAVVAGAL